MRDLATGRNRTINRLRARLAEACPALEAELDFTNHGPLVLISRFPTAAAIRAAGPDELHRWLRTWGGGVLFPRRRKATPHGRRGSRSRAARRAVAVRRSRSDP